jgi:hypothetical protein
MIGETLLVTLKDRDPSLVLEVLPCFYEKETPYLNNFCSFLYTKQLEVFFYVYMFSLPFYFITLEILNSFFYDIHSAVTDSSLSIICNY